MLRRRVPIVLQSEAAECGLACIAMILSYHGHVVSLSELRQRVGGAARGLTAAQVVAIAEESGLSARGLLISTSDIADLNLPCVLHWHARHYVVAESLAGDRLRIVDPATGARTVTLDELRDALSGLVLEMRPTPALQHKRGAASPRILGLFDAIDGFRSALARMLLLSLVFQITVLCMPLYMQIVIDQVIGGGHWGILDTIALGFCMLVVCQAAIAWSRSLVVSRFSATIGLAWSGNVFSHLLRLPIDFFLNRGLGDLSSRLASVGTLQRFYSLSVVEIAMDGLMAAATFAMMVVYGGIASLISLAAILLYALVRHVGIDKVRRATDEHLQLVGAQQSHTLDSIRGISTVKVAGMEDARLSGWRSLAQMAVDKDLRLSRMRFNFTVLSGFVFGLERIAVVYFCATLVLAGKFTPGMMVAFVAYKEIFTTRASALLDKLFELKSLEAHVARVSEITSLPVEADRTEPMHELRGAIQVEGLWFRYSPRDEWILRDCSFSIPAGALAVIIGASGEGKSTLVKLILGLLQPVRGTIRVDGVDIHSVNRDSYLRNVGVVMQDSSLLSGTIAENIALFGDIPASDVVAAAEAAGIRHEIESLPMGYDTPVGDHGAGLSAGQKQRIFLARALCRRSPLLILDEATSHLDPTRDVAVSEMIAGLSSTRIVVSHRPSITSRADLLFRIARGTISPIPHDRHVARRG